MKLFVCSDLHGFYTYFKQALEEKGFEKDDPNHLLIVCGDLFDRGKEAVKLWKYLKSINNKILIRGNHEDLMLEMIQRGYPLSHDINNGTLNTAKQFAWNKDFQEIDWNNLCSIFKHIVYQTIDYYETKNYVFVHGWIPVIVEDKLPAYYTRNRQFAFNEDWRNGDWSQARWLNGIQMNAEGLNPDKTVVCGHWHCSYGHHIQSGSEEFGNYAIWEPYYNKGIIAIDRCTAYTKQVNILVLEDELLEENVND